MQNHSTFNYPKLTPSFVAGFIVLLAMSFQILVNSNNKITDPFHVGEYFASFASMFIGQEIPGLITIHGALDFFPAWLSYAIYGPDHYFFGTIFLYALADVFAAIVFYVLVAILTERFASHYQAIVLIIVAMISTMLVNYRDLFLMASLLLYFTCQMELRPLFKRVAEVGLGLALALNLFWSFDRGIAGLVSIGLACLIMAYRSKHGLIAALSFFIFIFASNFSAEFLNLHNYFENIKFLLKTSSQWSYGLQAQPVIRSVAFLLLCLLALFVLFKNINEKWNHSISLFANGVLFFVLTIVFLKIGINRADLTHIHWGMWPALLAFLYAHNIRLGFGFDAANEDSHRNTLSVPKRHWLASLGFVFIFIVLVTPTSLMGGYYLLSSILNPRTNEELVSDGVKWVSSELINTKSECVLDLSNHGVINGLAGLPACTRFAYAIYANKDFQSEIIETIKNKKPKAIIYSSTHWSFAIDNKSMHIRFPELKSFLDIEYSNEVCKFDYCIRYFGKINPG